MDGTEGRISNEARFSIFCCFECCSGGSINFAHPSRKQRSLSGSALGIGIIAGTALGFLRIDDCGCKLSNKSWLMASGGSEQTEDAGSGGSGDFGK